LEFFSYILADERNPLGFRYSSSLNKMLLPLAIVINELTVSQLYKIFFLRVLDKLTSCKRKEKKPSLQKSLKEKKLSLKRKEKKPSLADLMATVNICKICFNCLSADYFIIFFLKNACCLCKKQSSFD